MENFDSYWLELEKVFAEDPKMLDHTRRVLDFSQQIVQSLSLTEKEKRVVYLASLLHDVGIVEASKKYGSREGKFQQIEGPPIAQRIMELQGETEDIQQRVLYLVANHHNFSRIDGLDFQILVEADMLVNLAEEKMEKDKLAKFIDDFFHTEEGKRLSKKHYLLNS